MPRSHLGKFSRLVRNFQTASTGRLMMMLFSNFVMVCHLLACALVAFQLSRPTIGFRRAEPRSGEGTRARALLARAQRVACKPGLAAPDEFLRQISRMA